MDNYHSTIAKNTLFLYLRMGIVMLVTLYTSRIVLRALGAVDYGLFNVVGGVVTIFLFFNMALSAATARYLAYELGRGNQQKLNQIFSTSLNLHIGLAIILLFILQTIGLWFVSTQMVIPSHRFHAAMWVYQFSIFTMIFTVTQVPYNASLIAHENMKIYAYIGLLEALMILVIGYSIQLSPIDRLIFYAAGLMAEKILVQLFLRYYTLRKYKECRFRFIKSKKIYPELLSYSAWELIGSLSYAGQTQGINIILNLFFGPIVNAARAISVQAQIACNTLIGNFLTAPEPRIVKFYSEGKKAETFNLTFAVGKYAFVLILLIVAPATAEINYLLNLWLGTHSYPSETATFTIIILYSALVQTLTQSLLIVFRAIGKIREGNCYSGIIMLLSLIIVYITLKLGFPAYSAFGEILLANIISFFVYLFFTWRYEHFNIKRYLLKTISPLMAITFVSCMLSFLLKHTMNASFVRVIYNFIVSDLAIIGFTWLFLLQKKEKMILIRKLRQLWK